MSEMVDTSNDRAAFSVATLIKQLFATFVSLAALISIIVFIIVITLRITAIHSLAPRILAGTADIALGTILLLGGIYATVRLFVRLLGISNIS